MTHSYTTSGDLTAMQQNTLKCCNQPIPARTVLHIEPTSTYARNEVLDLW